MIPMHERKILEAHVRGVKLSELSFQTDSLNEYQEVQLRELIKQRVKGFPIQYLIGTQDFYGREFYVNTAVLIPRPETEGLVELLLQELPEKIQNKRIYGLEFGTGSGCISLTIARERSDAFIIATDCMKDALSVAEENATKHRLGNVEFHHVSEEPQFWQYQDFESFDFIISNPPYLSSKDEIAQDVLEHEPHEALFAPEQDPLYFYRFLCELTEHKLKDGGIAFFEINHNLSQEVLNLFLQKFKVVKVLKDLTEKDRYIKVKK